MMVLPLYDDNPTARPPIATMAIIATCAVVFLWQQGLPPRAGDAAVLSYGMIPAVVLGDAHLAPVLQRVPAVATLVTSMFLHAGWMHILGNMLFLWIFGNNVEDSLGRIRFTVFYLACGVAAALAQGLADPGSQVPMIGASGAIGGVLGGYLLLHPHANVRVFVWFLVFVRLLDVPAWIVLGAWFAIQVVSGLGSPASGGGVAFWAHVGGFIAGAALVYLLKPRAVLILAPARTEAFVVSPAGELRRRHGFGGSVPEIRRRDRSRPWG